MCLLGCMERRDNSRGDKCRRARDDFYGDERPEVLLWDFVDKTSLAPVS